MATCRGSDPPPAGARVERLLAEKEDLQRRVKERDGRIADQQKQVAAAQQCAVKAAEALAIEHSGRGQDEEKAKHAETALRLDLAAVDRRLATLITQTDRVDGHAQALQAQLQVSARIEEELWFAVTSAQTELAGLNAAAARISQEADAAHHRHADTAESHAALQSEHDELNNDVTRLSQELAVARPEANASDESNRLILKHLLSEREGLSKQRGLAHVRMEEVNGRGVEERVQRERSDEAAAVAHAENRLRSEKVSRAAEVLQHERACVACGWRELEAAREETVSLLKRFESLERERSALAEHASAVGAQLAHALETDARLERERHYLLEVCCRQEQYWRLCCTRPKESIATDASGDQIICSV